MRELVVAVIFTYMVYWLILNIAITVLNGRKNKTTCWHSFSCENVAARCSNPVIFVLYPSMKTLILSARVSSVYGDEQQLAKMPRSEWWLRLGLHRVPS